MNIKCGILGLPNAGKSTLFNALTSSSAGVANYPFTTIDPNIGMVYVPDEILEKLAKIYSPVKITHAAFDIYDIAGLVKGASRGEGLGNQFLSHVRTVDAILHVVRLFRNENVAHIDSATDPVKDVCIINTELILKDIEILNRKLEATGKLAKGGDQRIKEESIFYKRLWDHLNREEPARRFKVQKNEQEWFDNLSPLTSKPVLYVLNADEGQVDNYTTMISDIRKASGDDNAPVITVVTKLEHEIRQLPEEDRSIFLKDMGIKESGLEKIIHTSVKLLDLITFYTCNNNEVRARFIRNGSSVYEAAGKVHTDMQKGFIRAEIAKASDLIESGSEQIARERGLIEVHGKDYRICEGDVVYIKFQI